MKHTNQNRFLKQQQQIKKLESGFQYMVDFKLPDILTEEFIALIPRQRNVVNRYFQYGKMVNYALSLEHSKLWAIFRANTEYEVLQMIADLPLTPLMDDVQVSSLTFYNSPVQSVPDFSFN
jgi:hypothetical protein